MVDSPAGGTFFWRTIARSTVGRYVRSRRGNNGVSESARKSSSGTAKPDAGRIAVSKKLLWNQLYFWLLAWQAVDT
jgi:hypothetical protein